MERREAEIRARLKKLTKDKPGLVWQSRNDARDLLGWLDEARRERDDALHGRELARADTKREQAEVARLTTALKHLRDDPSLGRMGRAIIDEAL